ncbi:MAG: Flp pilus assembly protein CpaB [Phycisphaerales bacterium]|nr:MAG: Flp pilus assembly protein CpaB [Phycisphaerales bacterium]
MKNRAIIPLVLGLVVGVLAVKFSVDAIQKAKGSRVDMEEVDAVIASSDIASSIRITPDMLMVRRTPKTPLLPPDAYASIDGLVGRVSKKFIPQGAVVTSAMIAEEGTLPGIEERIEEGYRAMAVKVDESTGVAYLLRPGCFVDVIVVMDVVKPGRKKETTSRVFLQRVKVGAVGQMLSETTTEDGPVRVRSVTLIVPEADVPKLHLAQTKGRLTLAMRSEDDTLITDNAEAHQDEVLGERRPQPGPFIGPLAGGPMAPPVADAAQDRDATVTVINGPDVIRIMYDGIRSMAVKGVQRGLTEGDSGATFVPAGPSYPRVDPGRRSALSPQERLLRRSGAGSTGSDWDSDYSEPAIKEVGE